MWRDTWLVFQRDMASAMRNPAWLLIGITQPLLYLFFFGPLFVRVLSAGGLSSSDGWLLLAPGLIAQLALFGGITVGFDLLADYRAGVVERLRVTPASRLALLLGKVFASAVQATVQALLLIVVALLVFRLDISPAGLGVSVLITFVLAVAIAACSNALALTLKSEQSFPALMNTVLMPVILLSGILIPIDGSTAPGWLRIVADVNPVSHIVTALRGAFHGDFSSGPVLVGGAVTVGFAVLAVWWGARTFGRENA
ncbi:ABC transporter permease [Amycolatopsis minnesotensis]|uniref:Transport permease protein n=1 Tax=Amycolatopsis minnesotensis TaxID=337894 RepID=A0ABP5E0Q8_9PSEU